MTTDKNTPNRRRDATPYNNSAARVGVPPAVPPSIARPPAACNFLLSGFSIAACTIRQLLRAGGAGPSGPRCARRRQYKTPADTGARTKDGFSFVVVTALSRRIHRTGFQGGNCEPDYTTTTF